MPVQSHEFVAIVEEDAKNGFVKIQQRNRFVEGDVLEVLSPDKETFNQTVLVQNMTNLAGQVVTDAKQVQQILILPTTLPLKKVWVFRFFLHKGVGKGVGCR